MVGDRSVGDETKKVITFLLWLTTSLTDPYYVTLPVYVRETT